jgi:hypothetical protein
MLHTLKLLLPALLPSWRFFDVIAPSPRIQYTLLTSAGQTPEHWTELQLSPAHLSLVQMLNHLFWNPVRNESLFMVSCAERLLEKPTQHSEEEILKRIIHRLGLGAASGKPLSPVTHIQFRLLLVRRDDNELTQDIAFCSRIKPVTQPDTA